MTDVLNPKQRSYCMSRVRGKNTSIELAVRQALHGKGFRFRLHAVELPGKPDIVLPRYRIAVFVHGCFWHGHGCGKSGLPKTHAKFWKQKIAQNKMRDAKNERALRALNWSVMNVWECGIEKGTNRLANRLQRKRRSRR